MTGGHTPEPPNTRWSIAARVLFPTEVVLKTPGTLADGMEPRPRAPEQTFAVAGVDVEIAPLPDEAPWEYSWGSITMIVAASDANAAIEASTEALERTLETLSFQLQTALHVESFHVTDAEAKEQGRSGQFMQLASEMPFPLRRFRTVPKEMGAVHTRQTPDGTFSLATFDAEQRLALDWYLKALASKFEMDRFLFFWISMECLWRRTVSLEVARGGRKGQKIRAFLRKSFEVNDSTAKAMWTARQVVHGERAFDPTVAGSLEEYSRYLRTGINAARKSALSLTDTDPPIITEPTLSVAAIGISGTTLGDTKENEG